MRKEDSLKKRYLAKMGANIVAMLANMGIAAVVPRGLGPRAYGDFDFLSDFFLRIVNFLEMGTSTCFYTKLSRRPQDFGLVSFYLFFSCLISLLLFFFIIVIHCSGFYIKLLPGQTPFYIYLGAVWGILTWGIYILNQMTDAYGVTFSAEFGKIIQRIIGLFIIMALFFTGQLNLTHFFLYHYFILIFLGLFFIWVMEKNRHSRIQSWKLSLVQVKNYIKEFYTYSHPLLSYSLVGLVVGILDRWLLQHFSGSMEQGFYGLSYQIGAICFLFTSAMTPLITRDFSIAYEKNDLQEMARLFRKFIPFLYSVAAYFACFIALEADKVTLIIGGDQFSQAILPVSIMAFYPIHQTYGQLSGSVFFAAGHTALYRNIGIFFMVLGLPLIYFLIAPADKMGLNAGSSGLAIKMVLLQFLGVNTQLWFNSRFLGLRFWRYLAHQVISVVVLLLLAGSAIYLIKIGLGGNSRVFLNFFLDGFLYSIMVLVMICFQPALFGLTRKDVHDLQGKLFRRFK